MAGLDVAPIVKKLVGEGRAGRGQVRGPLAEAGHATSDAIAGASERGIMAQTGHRSVQMVRRYMRDRSLFRRSARKLGV